MYYFEVIGIILYILKSSWKKKFNNPHGFAVYEGYPEGYYRLSRQSIPKHVLCKSGCIDSLSGCLDNPKRIVCMRGHLGIQKNGYSA